MGRAAVSGETDSEAAAALRGWAHRTPWDTHCRCLHVMSGKPVALDPEGERQRAST